MTDEPQPSEIAPPPAQTDAAKEVRAAEAAAIRRRWITLGEIVAVAGLLIAAVSLWLTYTDRRSDEAEKRADRQAEKASASRYEIAATVDGSGDLTIVRDGDHPLGDVTITFPKALGIAPLAAPAQTIALGAYRAALLKATDGGPDAQTGRLPVMLQVEYWDGDTRHEARGIYDIAWKMQGRVVLGRTLEIQGLTLRERGGTAGRLDQLWK